MLPDIPDAGRHLLEKTVDICRVCCIYFRPVDGLPFGIEVRKSPVRLFHLPLDQGDEILCIYQPLHLPCFVDSDHVGEDFIAYGVDELGVRIGHCLPGISFLVY